jgi:hypothetical protein
MFKPLTLAIKLALIPFAGGAVFEEATPGGEHHA